MIKSEMRNFLQLLGNFKSDKKEELLAKNGSLSVIYSISSESSSLMQSDQRRNGGVHIKEDEGNNSNRNNNREKQPGERDRWLVDKYLVEMEEQLN